MTSQAGQDIILALCELLFQNRSLGGRRQLQLSSDESCYRWGGVMIQHTGNINFGDYWSPEVVHVRDICYKESLALYFVLLSAIDQLWESHSNYFQDTQSLDRQGFMYSLTRIASLCFPALCYDPSPHQAVWQVGERSNYHGSSKTYSLKVVVA